jgi:hypothetical protein
MMGARAQIDRGKLNFVAINVSTELYRQILVTLKIAP